MTLLVKVPKEHIPNKVNLFKENPDVQYWVYLSNGTSKKYGEASAKEAFEWTKSLFQELPLKDCSSLKLMVAKSAILDICIDAAIIRNRNLFGGPEIWNNIPEWQRVSKIFKTKEKEEKKDK